MAREFTRKAFYELVWSQPVTHLAKEFHLSDVAIHKICRKHRIPTPPPGWWARKQAGQQVEMTVLPKAARGDADRIVIAAAEIGSAGAAFAAARENARVLLSDFPVEVGPDPHPVVDRTIAALRKTSPSPRGLLEVSGPKLVSTAISKASIVRAKLVLARVFSAAAVQGFRIEEDARGVHFAGGGEVISFSIIETVNRVKHVPTPSEQKQLDAWEKKLERQRGRSSWDRGIGMRPMFREWDFICTGQLSFKMESIGIAGRQRPRSTFRDAKTQQLESMAGDISVALAVLAVAKREERRRYEEEARIREEERRKREEPLRAQFIADRRRGELEGVLTELADLNRLRRLLAGLGDFRSVATPPRLATFLGWAAEELGARESRLSGEGLERRFEATRLFGDDDDHGFKAPYYY